MEPTIMKNITIDFIARISEVSSGCFLHTYGDTVRIRDQYCACVDVNIVILEKRLSLGAFSPAVLYFENPDLVSANVYDDFDDYCEAAGRERVACFTIGKVMRIRGNLLVRRRQGGTPNLLITNASGLRELKVREIDIGKRLVDSEVLDLDQEELPHVKKVEVDWSCFEFLEQ
jgi:hypothetical protein